MSFSKVGSNSLKGPRIVEKHAGNLSPRGEVNRKRKKKEAK